MKKRLDDEKRQELVSEWKQLPEIKKLEEEISKLTTEEKHEFRFDDFDFDKYIGQYTYCGTVEDLKKKTRDLLECLEEDKLKRNKRLDNESKGIVPKKLVQRFFNLPEHWKIYVAARVFFDPSSPSSFEKVDPNQIYQLLGYLDATNEKITKNNDSDDGSYELFLKKIHEGISVAESEI